VSESLHGASGSIGRRPQPKRKIKVQNGSGSIIVAAQKRNGACLARLMHGWAGGGGHYCSLYGKRNLESDRAAGQLVCVYLRERERD